MLDRFQAFIKRSRRDALIKCASVGASAALAAVGAILLAAKLAGFGLTYCLLGLIALPVGAAVCFAFVHEGPRRLSRRMDDTFALGERVQTMLEFEGADGEMIKLQREDAEDKLAQIPVKRLKLQGLWLYILLPVLSVSLLLGAFICPEAAEEEPGIRPGEEEPPRDITDWEWKALDELIEYVRASDADPDVMKPETLSSLEGLRSLLLVGVSDQSLKLFVSQTATEINNIETKANEGKLTEQQKVQNTEVARYAVSKLYEIFGMTEPVESGGEDTDKKDDGDGNGEQNSGAFGDVNMAANDLMFDPKRGYVKYGEVIDEYNAEIQKAFGDGVLSDEELYAFIMAYFGYLTNGE